MYLADSGSDVSPSDDEDDDVDWEDGGQVDQDDDQVDKKTSLYQVDSQHVNNEDEDESTEKGKDAVGMGTTCSAARRGGLWKLKLI